MNSYENKEEKIINAEVQQDTENSLSVWGAVLIIISTMIGGSIVTLPFAFYQLGLVFGTAFMIFNAFLTANRAWIYLKTKDLIPGQPESMFEIGYYLLGRKSIFIISIVIFLNSFGVCIAMFILVGKTMGSLTKDIFSISSTSNGFA